MNQINVDQMYMKLALQAAREARDRSEFPVGAVLTIDDKLVGVASNNLLANGNWSSHAEKLLIDRYGREIRATPADKKLQIYATLEPCLMCMGAIMLNKFDRLVYGCRDPFGGATGLDLNSLPEWYRGKWPDVQGGVLARESYDLLVEYMAGNSEAWAGVLPSFLKMGRPSQ